VSTLNCFVRLGQGSCVICCTDWLQHQHPAAPANLDEAHDCARDRPHMHVGLQACCPDRAPTCVMCAASPAVHEGALGPEGAEQALERSSHEPVRRRSEGVLPRGRLRGRHHRRAGPNPLSAPLQMCCMTQSYENRLQ